MSELNTGRELWKHCYQYIKLGPSELKQKQQQNFSILTLIRLEVSNKIYKNCTNEHEFSSLFIWKTTRKSLFK